MRILDITVRQPLTTLLAVLDEAMVRTAARNAGVALAEEVARREQWRREERHLELTAPSARSA
jgi:hypothetical protein